MTKDEESKSVPTATQVVSTGQATALSLEPLGTEVVVLQTVKLLVLKVVIPPPAFRPTATQVVTAEHEMPVSTTRLDSICPVHEFPSCDSRIDGSPLVVPIAAQLMALGQDTFVIDVVPVGAVCCVQVVPSVVLTRLAPRTAVHSSIVKQEIETVGDVGSMTLQVIPPFVDFRIPAPPPA
jgi:hypothetical protein